MTLEMHLLGEAIQEVTLYAWPILYGDDNRFDKDSNELLEMLRDWAEEFEQWWQSHDEKWEAAHDYPEECQSFTARKCMDYIKNFT